MKLYYSTKQQAETVASDLKCCGFSVTITLIDNLYEVLAT